MTGVSRAVRPHALTLLAAAALVAGALTASVTEPASATASGRPSVGECHDLTVAQVNAPSDSRPPVDCAQSHTTRTIRVAQLPSGTSWNDGADQISRTVERTCLPARDEALGRTDKVRDRSAYTFVWFVPTRAEREAGARWFRCDLALNGGSRMLPLPTDETPALGGLPLPDSVARCLHPDTLITTTCARTHTWRSTGSFTLRLADHPSEKRVRTAALKRCPALVTTGRYRWTYRGEVGWKLGDHVVVCYSKTRS
jgi:hypothetical protein